MKNTANLIISLSLITGIFFGSLPNVKACGPFSVDPIFSFTKHGTYPLETYIGNEPGIVPNSYGRISLFPFYRQLTATPLSKNESEQVVAAIKKRIGIGELTSGGEEVSTEEPAEPEFFQNWMTVRKKVLESKTEIDTMKSVPVGYGYYQNCLPDSFNTATETINSRIKKYGINENTRDWVVAQDAVFSNCGGDEGRMPKQSLSGEAWLKKDRDYQIAAAYFYATKLPEARAAFEKIGADQDSPWKNTAKFVAARTLIREASFIDTDEDADGAKALAQKNLLEKAEANLKIILADPSMKDFHESAGRLSGLVKFRKDSPGRQEELAGVLSSQTENSNIFNDLTDYIWLLDKPEREAYNVGYEIDSREAQAKGLEYWDYNLKIRDLPAETRPSDLSDWLFTYQAEDGFLHAFEKWKSTKRLHWFVSTISHATNDSQNLDLILGEASKIDRTSAAFPTVRFNQIRLLLGSGKRMEAKKLIEQVFHDGFARFPTSTQNKFLSQRMIVSDSLNEFLTYSQRKPAVFAWSDDGTEAGDELRKEDGLYPWKDRTMFDFDSVAFFNHRMPLETLKIAALSPKLPVHLQKFVITAAWMRAFLLRDRAMQAELTPRFSQASPELRAKFTPYANARTPVEQEANGLLFVLSYPILQPYVPPGTGRGEIEPQSIDTFRGNWWCTDEANPFEKSQIEASEPDFLDTSQKAAAAKEEIDLRSLGNSATNLTRRAIEFSKANPSHRLVPQLLHLAVRSTRYGCGDKDTGTFSKEAYNLLHQKYPRSPWTKRTPYWFNGNGA